MNEARIWVRFENGEKGFAPNKTYEVLMVQDLKLLLIDEDARLVWVDPARATPALVSRGNERLFDLEIHRTRRKLEDLAGKPVILTTWENLGFEPDEVTDEAMLVYRGVVDFYDGETLFLKRYDREQSRFGVLPKAIATIVEDHEP